MKKRLLSLALVVTMLFSGAIAFATSPGGDDFWYDVEIIPGDPNYGSDTGFGEETWYIVFRNELPEIQTEFAKEVLATIEAFLKGDKVINFFDATTIKEIAALLPSGFNLNNLIMYEFTSLKVQIDTVLPTGAEAKFSFPTKFEVGKKLVAVIGVKVGNSIVWIPLEAQVVSDAKFNIKIKFTKEALAAMQNATEIMLAILSEKI